MKQTEAYQRLVEKGIRPSLQRIAIMDWLIKHPTHPTIEDVYKGLAESIPTLSKTTVYNTWYSIDTLKHTKRLGLI